MIDTVKINRLAELISNASRTAIVTHMKPDGDAMGSSLAMYRFLRENTSADVRIVLNDRYPANLAFMTAPEEASRILVCNEDADAAAGWITGADLIICLDFNAFHRTENLERPLLEAKGTNIISHPPSSISRWPFQPRRFHRHPSWCSIFSRPCLSAAVIRQNSR